MPGDTWLGGLTVQCLGPRCQDHKGYSDPKDSPFSWDQLICILFISKIQTEEMKASEKYQEHVHWTQLVQMDQLGSTDLRGVFDPEDTRRVETSEH